MTFVKTAEEEFISNLEMFLDTDFSDSTKARVLKYAKDYHKSLNPPQKEYITKEVIIYKEPPVHNDNDKEATLISQSDVINVVTHITGFTFYSLASKNREREVVTARYVAMYAMKEFIKTLTLKKIGHRFNRDHSTVIHAIAEVKNMLETKDPTYTSLVNSVFNKIKATA